MCLVWLGAESSLLPVELRAALAPALPCTIVTSHFHLSSQNELGVGEATIFSFTGSGSGSSVHYSKEPAPFGAMPNGA